MLQISLLTVVLRFRINSKIPRGPPSPPAPVMHSPTRKVTVKEQQDWKIPPCISNWKNAKVSLFETVFYGVVFTIQGLARDYANACAL